MKCKKIDRALWNVLMQSSSIMIGIAAVVALMNAENYVIDSEKKIYQNYHPQALLGMFLFYMSAILFLLVTPSLVAAAGPRTIFILGTAARAMFVVTFFLPYDWAFYIGALFGGINLAFIFGAEGVYRILNSTKETITRNSIIFCLLMQSSFLIGNACVFLTIHTEDLTVKEIRMFLIVCTVLACIPFFLIAMMTRAVYKYVNRKGPKEILNELMLLCIERDMMLMYFPILYCGLVQSVVQGIYSSSLAFARDFAMNKIKLVSLSGMLIGVGEIISGVLFIFLSRVKHVHGHRYFMLFGFILNTTVHIAILLTLPLKSTKGVSKEPAILKGNLPLALTCSVLIGFGDNCVMTQNYGFVGKRFSDKCGPACTILTLHRSLGLAIGFLCAKVGYDVLFGVIFSFGLLGTITFFIVEIRQSHYPHNELDLDVPPRNVISKSLLT